MWKQISFNIHLFVNNNINIIKDSVINCINIQLTCKRINLQLYFKVLFSGGSFVPVSWVSVALIYFSQ